MTVQLGYLSSGDGFTIRGGADNQNVGRDVHAAGDVNGDGITDVIVGSYTGAYVVYGKNNATRQDIDLENLNPSDGFRISQPDNSSFGKIVSVAGDVNNDGFDDVIISDPWASNNPNGGGGGTVYVIFGASSVANAAGVDVDTMTSSQGVRIFGATDASGLFGRSISTAGDFDGDGKDDLLIGSRGEFSNNGAAYLVTGAAIANAVNGEINLDSSQGLSGFPADVRLITSALGGANLGVAVAGGGDINGDGDADLVISAPYVSGYGTAGGGAVAIITGVRNNNTELSVFDFDDFAQRVVAGTDTWGTLGTDAAIVRDINGDNIDDVIFSSTLNDDNGSNAGAIFVYYGSTGFSSSLSQVVSTNFSTSDGFRILGAQSSAYVGSSISSAGDFNGDGIGDLLINSFSYNNYRGAAYVVFGTAGAARGDLYLNQLSASDGILLTGRNNFDYSGYSVSAAGDMNGDGHDDIIIGAFGNDIDVNGGSGINSGSGNNIGAAYVVYGYAPPSGEVLTGTANPDNLEGHGYNDTISGLAGNDFLVGNGGDDLISGGDDDDFVVGRTGNDTIDGNNGNDNLHGEDGDDSVLGGDGDDGINGGAGADTLLGGYGNDLLDAWTGDDDLYGEAGSDTLNGQDGDDHLYGGAENDTLDGGSGLNTLAGGADDDLYYMSTETDVLQEDLNNGTDTVITAFSYTLADNFENLTLTGGSTINGTGNAANNVIVGNGDENVLSGLDGSDTITGGVGNDTIDGGSGSDYAVYTENRADVFVTYDIDTDTFTLDMAGGEDKVTNVEMFRFADRDVTATALKGVFLDDFNNSWTGTNDDDAVRGFGGNDTLTGGKGNDLIYGGTGNDSLSGGAGKDLLDGGDGNDVLMFGAGDDAVLGGNGNDYIDDVRNAEAVGANVLDGGAGNDSVWAGAGNDTLSGGDGNDLLSGESGDDFLYGDDGADRLVGGAGSDTLTGGAGNDSFVVDSGTDEINDLSEGDVLQISGSGAAIVNVVTVWTATAASSNTGSASLTTYGNAVNLAAASGQIGYSVTNMGAATTLTGSAFADFLSGGNTGDTLLGGTGNDSLRGGFGDDSLNGGVGFDIAYYDGYGASITVDLAVTVAQNTGSWGSDILVGIEGLVGSAYSDVLSGNAAANWLEGGDGGDTLSGADGADTLLGGAGDDSLTGGLGNDSLTGGAGADRFIVGAGKDVISDLGAGGADVLSVASGATATATLAAGWTATSATVNAGTAALATSGYAVDLSAVTGGTKGFTVSNTGAVTTMIGSVFADTISGWSGADTLMGGGGNDSLLGGSGNNILNGGLGDDTLSGGAGFDSASYADAAGGVSVSLAITAAQNTVSAGLDKLVTMEGLIGSGFDDSLTGDSAANRLEGGAGNDSLTGADGADTLLGGVGYDYLTGGAGNDVLTGGADADLFTVGAGKDVITDLGAGGADVLNVASGATATATLAAAWTATSASSNAGTASLTTNGYAVDLSAITGGSKGFTVTNTGAAATLIGSNYADSLSGGAGDDWLTGADGNDSLSGGAGEDWLMGGNGTDLLTGGAGNDTLDGGQGADSFVFGQLSGVDHVTDFTSGSDRLMLAKSVMTGLGAVGTLTSAAFWTGSAAHDLTDRIIYDSTTGAVLYDADGSGSGAAIQFAILDGQPALTYTDVLVF